MQSFMSRVTRVIIVSMVLFVVAAITLFLLGGRQRQYKTQVEIAAPKEVVFQYLTDPAKIQKWSGGKAQIRPLTDEGHKEGAQTHISLVYGGMRLEIESEVLETLLNERLITELSSTQMTARSDFQLEESDGSTLLNHSFQVTPLGMSRLYAPFSRQQLQAELDSGLRNLKQVIEDEYRQRQTP